MTTTTDAVPVLAEEDALPGEVMTSAIAKPRLTPRERLVSLDVFRGITIAFMLMVNFSSVGEYFEALEHAPWHGWTPTDLIFPFFLFIVGVAVPFSLAKRSASASSKWSMLGVIWIRALALIMCGYFLMGLPFANMDPIPGEFAALRILHIATIVFFFFGFVALLYPWKSRLGLWLPLIATAGYILFYWLNVWVARSAYAHGLPTDFHLGNGIFTPWKLRFPGILQRIGICYGIGASIALFANRWLILLTLVGLFAVYSVMMLGMRYPDHETGSLTKDDNLARRIDEAVWKQHNYSSYPDPEGLLSTLPAIGSVLLGALVGRWMKSDRDPTERCAGVFTWGFVTTIIGVLLSWWLMPINKQIWTPSFTVFSAGLGMLMLGACYYAVDIRGYRKLAWPATVYGMNAIGAFIFSGIIYRVLAYVQIHDWRSHDSDTKISLWRIGQNAIADGIHNFANWAATISPHIPHLDAKGLIALAQAISWIFVLWLLMAVLYLCRIFIRV